MIKITCYCGNTRNVYPRDIKRGWGKYCSQSCANKKNQKASGENHGNWRGDKVGLDALHDWVKRRLVMPLLCEACKLVPPYDLANISGLYLRLLSDWEWLCRRCHMLKDGRFKNLKNQVI